MGKSAASMHHSVLVQAQLLQYKVVGHHQQSASPYEYQQYLQLPIPEDRVIPVHCLS